MRPALCWLESAAPVHKLLHLHVGLGNVVVASSRVHIVAFQATPQRLEGRVLWHQSEAIR